MTQTQEDCEDCHVKDSWRGPFKRIKEYVEHRVKLGWVIQPKQALGKSWRCKVSGIWYSEMWLRYYNQFRHLHSCTVMCSDYANRMTGVRKPIVRDLELDLELHLAHAKLQHKVGKPVRKGEL